MSTNEHELLNIEVQTLVLKVHMNCEGCRAKVKKVLRKVEGVYGVDINAEEQEVMVTGIVNPSTLVQKLAKLGKHAEIWNEEDYSQEHIDDENNVKDNNEEYIMNDTSAYENQYMIPTFYGQDINQYLAAPTPPLFFESFNNRENENAIRISDYPKWMWPANFQENSGINYSGLWNQERPHNILGVSSTIGEYGYHYQPSLRPNIHGYYHGY
ncbi:heavy metal-associated isoprenylated plant protein 28-like [Vicia villosa]|uniref:heavy metal-associated isoprenylated plant protein 28-like n=1 Tax=Vicia villosa TaxID=3911 RepID=UPI00273AF85D|nr:heavy metal-associated isoprenylated plant protein 28-like [Vicia villosa]